MRIFGATLLYICIYYEIDAGVILFNMLMNSTTLAPHELRSSYQASWRELVQDTFLL